MKRPKDLSKVTIIDNNDTKEYIKYINEDSEYSLEVDPQGLYNMSDEEKTFVLNYIEFKNIFIICQLLGIKEQDGKDMFAKYSVQQEIKRITKALYHRMFAKKMLTVDEVGGYLSSLITGENVPISEQLKPSDKIKAVSMLIDLNILKSNMKDNQGIIDVDDVEESVKDISLDTIKGLLAGKKEGNNKENIIDQIDKDGILSEEEKNMLRQMPLKELLIILDDINGGKNEEE